MMLSAVIAAVLSDASRDRALFLREHVYTFEEFMRDAVYDPVFGYYNSGRGGIFMNQQGMAESFSSEAGPQASGGDFWTHATARTIIYQLVQIYDLCRCSYVLLYAFCT
jgi:hypothetical protein